MVICLLGIAVTASAQFKTFDDSEGTWSGLRASYLT